jgi:hypothetical protein
MSIGGDKEGLSIITVKKAVLLDKLRENRAAHEKAYNEAKLKFSAAYCTRLEEMLLDAKEGRSFDRWVNVDEPTSHVNDYNRIISMLDMSVADEIKITEREFVKYALDEWDWKEGFTNITNSYGGRVAK